MKKLISLLVSIFLLAGQAFAALPDQLKTARMTDSTLASTIDNEVGNLEKAAAAILGIPIDTDISNAMFAATASGLTKVIFQNLAGDPTAAGELARNGTALKFHDGTAARTLLTSATTIGASVGGTGQDSSSSTGIPKVAAGTWSFPTRVGAADGGTNIDTSALTGVPKIAAGTWSTEAQVASVRGGSGADLSACAQGTIPYFSATGVQSCLAVGTNGQALITQGAAANPAYFTLPLTKAFASSQQTITAAGALTIAHGLGAVPILVDWELVNTSAEGNYGVNDIYKGSFLDFGGGGRGISIVPDATNLNIRFGSNANFINIPDKTTGADTPITNSKWKIVFRAFL